MMSHRMGTITCSYFAPNTHTDEPKEEDPETDQVDTETFRSSEKLRH